MLLLRTVTVFTLIVNYLSGNVLADTNNVGIVGGYTISIKDAPYMASVRRDGSRWCGGSIIHERFILTAAHCVREENANYTVLVGTDNINEGGMLYNTEKIIVHEKFDWRSCDYDMCLLKLARNLTFGPNVTAVELNDGRLNLTEQMLLRATGWGWTESSRPQYLQQVEIPFVPTNNCTEIYKDYLMTPRMMCAGTKGKNVCNGDSGGPLTYENFQVGITSFGDGCFKGASVFTRINKLLPWIITKIN